MDTLILIEDDPKLDQALQQFPIQPPRRGGCLRIEKLPKVSQKTVSRRTATNGASLDLRIVNFVCKAIIRFAKVALERHLQKLHHSRTTIPEFQIIVIFH